MTAPALSEHDRYRVEVLLQRVGAVAEDLREEYAEILSTPSAAPADASPADAPAAV